MTSVLIVEDDDDIREILAEMLSDDGYVVETARNGQEGLEAMRRLVPAPAIVILDLMMPVMDGWQLRKEMLLDPALANIPVLVVSGAADLAASLVSLDVAKILTKPVKWPVLLDSVRQYSRS